MQLVQNPAAKVLTGTRKCSSISLVLASLHWIPVDFRMQYKVLLMDFKSLHGPSSEYISSLLRLFCLLNVQKNGDSAFSVTVPCLWNSLPLHIRSCDSTEFFKSVLKTHRYTVAYNHPYKNGD